MPAEVNSTADAPANVVIVDDHPLLAQSLAIALGSDGIDVERCELTEASIVGIVETLAPEVVLLDLDLGGEIGTSLPLIPELIGRQTRVVMLTGVQDEVRLAECIEAGAVGVIAKSEPFERLVEGVRQVVADGTLLTEHQRQEQLALLRRHRATERERLAAFDQLTPRERQVLAALMDGLSAEQMAQEWVVSLATVRSQIRTLLAKLEVNSQLSAVAAARRAGWAATPD